MQPRLPLPICSPHVVLAASGLGSPCRPRPGHFAACRRASLRPTLTSVRQHPPPPPPHPRSHPRWSHTVQNGQVCSWCSHYAGRGRRQGWRKVFSIFGFFVGGEEQEGSNIASGSHPWNFLWQISFCFCFCFFLAVFVFLLSPPRSHCSITMSEATVAEYKCVVPPGLCLEGASLGVIAGLAGQLSRP